MSRAKTSPSMSILSLFLLLVTFHSVLADDFDCKISKDGHEFDLTSLGKHTATRTRQTPPTKVIDLVTIDLCNDLPIDDGAAAQQCPKGTRACLTKTNESDEGKRVVAVIPIAQTSKLKPESRIIKSPSDGLELILHGDEYPSPNEVTKRPQSLNLTLLCSESVSEPAFSSYDGAVLSIEWSNPVGCADKKGDGGGDAPADPKPEDSYSRGSGIGWFFLVILVAFILYFILGAYYKYSNYGASGYDLVPHRDFWREVPYMLRDVVSHLCSTIRPRQSSRGGYIAV